MEENKISQFLSSLMTYRFRHMVFISPLLAGTIGFLFPLLRGKGFSESLWNAAFLFLLICFIGIVYEVMMRLRNH